MKLLCLLCDGETEGLEARGMQLARCKGCGLIFQKQRYQGEYIQNEPEWGEEDVRFKESTYKIKLKTFEWLFAQLKEYLPEKGRLRVLDVGCGTGALLEVARRRGDEAFGIEPDRRFFKEAKRKGLEVVNTSFEKARLKKQDFDVVIFYDVLEHLRDLKQVGERVRRVLKEEGIWVIVTPNTSNWLFKLFGKNWPHFKREHVFYFGDKSIKQLFSLFGFSILSIQEAFKVLNWDYARGYFTIFPTSLLSFITRYVNSILPKRWRETGWLLPSGNMLVVGKNTGEAFGDLAKIHVFKPRVEIAKTVLPN